MVQMQWGFYFRSCWSITLQHRLLSNQVAQLTSIWPVATVNSQPNITQRLIKQEVWEFVATAVDSANFKFSLSGLKTLKVFIVSQMCRCKQHSCQMTTKTHFVLAVIELWGAPSKQKVKIRFSPSAEERDEYLSVRVRRREERKRRMIKGPDLLCSRRERQKERDRKI